MRKAAAIFLILALAVCCLNVYGVKALDEPKDKVEYSLTDNYGSRSAAEGLEFYESFDYCGHVFWDSCISVAEGELNSSTDFSFSGEYQDRRHYDALESGVQFFIDPQGECALDHLAEKDELYLPPEANGMQKAWLELAKTTEPGGIGKKTLRLADVSDYYPLIMNMEIGGLCCSYYPEIYNEVKTRENKIILMMNEYFRIPVRDDAYCTLIFERSSENGWIIFSEVPEEHPNTYDPVTFNVFSQGTCYFCFTNRTSEGDIVDTSLIPSGYGIYALPYGTSPGDPDFGQDPEALYPDIFPEKLSLLYAVDPKAQIIDMSPTKDGEQVALQTEEGGVTYLTMISLKTGEETGRFLLGEYDDSYCPLHFIDSGFAVYKNNDDLCVFTQKSDGSWQQEFTAELMKTEQEDTLPDEYYWRNQTMAFDGERLAIVRAIETEEDRTEATGEILYRRESCKSCIIIYTKDGLQYYGTVSCSLGELNYNSIHDDFSYYYRNVAYSEGGPKRCRWVK